MDIESAQRDIDFTEVDEPTVRGFSKNSQYYSLAFDLWRETAQYACLLASILPMEQRAWNRDQAVLGGHLVRIFKLMRFVIDEANQNRAELIWPLFRQLSECVINFRYLVENFSPDVLNSFICQSLQHERDLLNFIQEQAAERGGERLPIEVRMLRSITRAFLESGLSPEELPKKRIRNWANKNLYEKAQALGLAEAYAAIFSGPSRNVHGGWQDLLQHHLKHVGEGKFEPKLEFTLPRPQPVFVLAILIVSSLVAYVDFLGAEQLSDVRQRLMNLVDRISLADDLHEQFLVASAA